MTGIPKSLCIIRLSALGDVTHMLPVIHTLKKYWPGTRITWVIGRVEHRLVGSLPGVEFIVFDKKKGIREYLRLRRLLRDRVFDVLLLMQVALRANLIAPMIRAGMKIGYDRARSKDFHGWFISRRIASAPEQHVVDSFLSFLETLGLTQAVYDWTLPEDSGEADLAARFIDPSKRCMIISPCSSHSLRNWHAEGYAAVADYAAGRYGMQVLICGGASDTEHRMADRIVHLCERADPVNLVGKDTFSRFIGLLKRADVLLSPDSGPAHMAAVAGIPVIGLHAASNPRRSGPYKSLDWCVDRYDDAARKYLLKPASELKWGTKIERPGVMDLVTVSMVMEKLDKLMTYLKENETDVRNTDTGIARRSDR